MIQNHRVEFDVNDSHCYALSVFVTSVVTVLLLKIENLCFFSKFEAFEIGSVVNEQLDLEAWSTNRFGT